MRKTVAILLLSTFLMNAIGNVGLYALMRWQIVHEISELIRHGVHYSDFHTELILSKKEMNPESGDFDRINKHEFRYKGKMYDIVSQKQVGETIHYTVIHDRKDELNFDRLAADIDLQVQSRPNGKAPKSALLDSMVKGLFTPLFFTSINHYNDKQITLFLGFIPRNTLPETPYLQVPVPPPKIV